MTSSIGLFIIAAFAVLGYSVLLNRLAHMVQPMRVHCAYLGEKLLANPRLPEIERDRLEFSLTNAYNGWIPIAVVLVMPFVGLSILFQKDEALANFDPALEREVEWVHAKLLLARMMCSPILFFIALVEMTVFMVLAACMGHSLSFIKHLMSRLDSAGSYVHSSVAVRNP